MVFVVGTSLVVWPFAFLAHMVPPEVPLVLINNEDSLSERKNKVWLGGDIQENICKISKDLGWDLWFLMPYMCNIFINNEKCK